MKKFPAMGRKRTKLILTPSQQHELTELLRENTDPRICERLKFLKNGVGGHHTLEELAMLAGRSRSTIQNWLGKFQSGGLRGLLDRDAPPGRESPLAQPRIQRQLEAARRSGEVKTAADVVLWLEKRHKIKRARKSIYYWLRHRKTAFPKRQRAK